MAYIDSLLASGERVAPARAPALVRGRRRRAVRDPRDRRGDPAPASCRRRQRSDDGAFDQVIGYVVLALVVGGLAYLGWQILRWMNEDYIVTNRRVLQVEGVINKRARRQLAREDQRRGPDPVTYRADLRLRRSRHPDRVGGRDLAAPDAHATRTTSSGRCSSRSTTSSSSCPARGRCRRRRSGRRPAGSLQPAGPPSPRRRRLPSPLAGRRDVAGRRDADAGQPRRPARSRRDQPRGVRGEEGGPAAAACSIRGAAAPPPVTPTRRTHLVSVAPDSRSIRR